MKRKTPAGPGLRNVSGEGQGKKTINSRIIAHLTRTRHRIAKWIAPDLIWNPDMSLELDHCIDAYEAACIEIERLKSLVGAGTHSEVRHD